MAPRSSLRLTIAGVLALSTAAAQADDQQSSAKAPATEGGTQLESFVVTARRIEESAQTVPVALTAFSGAQLEERHIATPQDLQGQVPSLHVSPYGQTRDVAMFVVRGQATTYGAAPAVVQYMAEVPMVSGAITSLQGTPGQFLDLENVQVLRGPQGTLFGRNTTGGAILLEPARPTNDFTGRLQLQAGNYGDLEAQAVVNIPVNDRLLVRIAGGFTDREGYTRDIVTGKDYDNRHYWTGRLGVTWTPTDSVENYLMASGADSRSHGSGWVLNGFNTPYIDAMFAPYGGCAVMGLGAGCSALTQLADAQHARGPRHVALGPTPPSLENTIKGWNVLDQLKITLSDSLALRNIMSYGSLESEGPLDGDGTPLPWYNGNLSLSGPTDTVRQFTEELQLQGSAFDDDLIYTAGVYYESVETPSTVGLQNLLFLVQNTGVAYRYENSAKAVYAQLGYDFGAASSALGGLKLTAGARYTWDEVDAASSGFALHDGVIIGCTNGLPVVPTDVMDCAVKGSQSSSAPSWTAGLDYLFDERLLVYGKATRGYKRGGFNLYAVNPSHLTYKPEYVTTYELGFKATFTGGSVPFTFNADVFHTDYEDIQVASGDYNPVSLASGAAVFNAAAATLKGVEVEASVVPFTGLELSANYSHLEGDYDEFELFSPFGQFDCSGNYTVGTVDLKCMPFSYLPEDQFSLNAHYTLPLPASVGEVVLGASYAYTGELTHGTTQLPQYDLGSTYPSTDLVNLSLQWNGMFGTSFDVGFFMTNATDETYRVTNTGVYQTLGVDSGLYGEPRMYGVQVRYHW